MTPKLRPIRTRRRDASVTRRAVSAAVKDLAREEPTTGTESRQARNGQLRDEVGSAKEGARYLALVRRASLPKSLRAAKAKPQQSRRTPETLKK